MVGMCLQSHNMSPHLETDLVINYSHSGDHYNYVWWLQNLFIWSP